MAPGAGGAPAGAEPAPRDDPPQSGPDQPEPTPPPAAPEPAPNASRAAARDAIRETRPGGPAEPEQRAGDPDVDAAAHPDDPEADPTGLAGAELLQRELGAQVIEEIRHS